MMRLLRLLAYLAPVSQHWFCLMGAFVKTCLEVPVLHGCNVKRTKCPHIKGKRVRGAGSVDSEKWAEAIEIISTVDRVQIKLECIPTLLCKTYSATYLPLAAEMAAKICTFPLPCSNE
jgi:hypothetical protein